MPDPLAEFQAVVRAWKPRAAIVLGSGLGELGTHFQEETSLPFSEFPELPPATAPGHAGRLALGTWNGTPSLVFFGRLHFYEGHGWEAVTAPVRLAASLGARTLILTNAAGGIHPELEPGSLMAILGHIPLLDPEGWKHLEVRTPYSFRLLSELKSRGLRDGTYAALTGPNYETPAEIRALKKMGADAVGMSTAREAEAARQLGLEVAGISCITNLAAGIGDSTLDHGQVVATAQLATRKLAEAINRLIAGI